MHIPRRGRWWARQTSLIALPTVVMGSLYVLHRYAATLYLGELSGDLRLGDQYMFLHNPRNVTLIHPSAWNEAQVFKKEEGAGSEGAESKGQVAQEVPRPPDEGNRLPDEGKHQIPVTIPPEKRTTEYNPLKNPDRFSFIHDRKKMKLTNRRILNPLPSRVAYVHDPVNHTCSLEDPPFVLVLVISAVGNRERREVIRNTWGHRVWYQYTRIRTVFIMGATEDLEKQRAVDQEYKQHKDIIQYNFIDSYKNLTYKSISLFSWATSRCVETVFLAKVDDDVLVNPFHLKTFLIDQLSSPPQTKGVREGDELITIRKGTNSAMYHIYGRYDSEPYPMRYSKWGVTMEEYPEKSYPPFVHGPAYIVGREAAKELVKFMPYIPLIKLEDVYTTGLVAFAAGIRHVQIFNNINTFKAGPSLYNGTQAFLEEQGTKTRELAWREILKFAPKA